MIISLIFTACGGGSNNASNVGSGPFITTWKTDNDGKTDKNQIEISTNPEYTYDFNVDWGDGNISTGISESIVHTYTKEGIYTVKITGKYPHIYFDYEYTGRYTGVDDRDKILTVEQWGNIKWKSMYSAFIGCDSLTINAKDNPNLSTVKDLSSMFAATKNVNTNISHWDVSHIITMSNLFAGSNFNGDISKWNVSNVVDMSAMFQGAAKFNQDISKWNTSSVEDMSFMFSDAKEFNQNIEVWDVSNVTTMDSMFWQARKFNQPLNKWNVSNVNNMHGMFATTEKFNQPLDKWDVSGVTDMSQMFYQALVFNQDIGVWDVSSIRSFEFMFHTSPKFNQNLSAWNIENVEDMRDMFYGVTLSTSHYDALLKSWGNQDVHSYTHFGRINSTYSISAKPARDKLNNEYMWEIVDLGMQ